MPERKRFFSIDPFPNNDDEGDADVGKDGGDDGAENLGYTAILSVWHQGDNYRKLLLDFRH